MKKKDLKSGWMCKLSSGEEVVVLKGTTDGDLLASFPSGCCANRLHDYFRLNNYNEDLTVTSGNPAFDINSVMDMYREHIWTRPEEVELEVELEVGEWYEFNYCNKVTTAVLTKKTVDKDADGFVYRFSGFSGDMYRKDMWSSDEYDKFFIRNYKHLSEYEVASFLLGKCDEMGFKRGTLIKTAKNKLTRVLAGDLKYRKDYNGVKHAVYTNSEYSEKDVCVFTQDNGFSTIGDFVAR